MSQSVSQDDKGQWWVAVEPGKPRAGPFESNASAWAWFDRNSTDDERQQRIRTNFTRKYFE